MASRIYWKRITSALIRFGKDQEKEAKSFLKKGKHYDTGKLDSSINTYLEDLDGGVRKILNFEFITYGQFSDRWYKKSSIKKIKKNGRIVRTGVRDRPTFIENFWDNTDELNDIIEDSAVEDLEANINEYVKEFNTKNK